MDATVVKLTRRNALQVAIAICKAADKETRKACDVAGWSKDALIDALTRAQDAARSKRSGEPTASQAKNDNLVRTVLVPFVGACSEPVTSSVVRDGVGHPDIRTTQKATTLIRRAVTLGLLKPSPYITETVSVRTGKVVRHNVAYQVPGFDWSGFAPAQKRAKATED